MAIGLYRDITINPAHLISSAGGRGVQPPVSTNRYAFHYLKHPWGFTIVHPRRCGEPQNGDRDCIRGAEINPAHMISHRGGGSGRGWKPPPAILLFFQIESQRDADTPRGSASLAPAVAANPNNAMGAVSDGVEIKTYSTPFNSAHLISSAGGRGVQPPSARTEMLSIYLRRP